MYLYKNIIQLLVVGVMFISPFQRLAAQENSIMEVQLMAMVNADDEVVLRWAPINVESWEWGNTAGYDLQRYMTVDENGIAIAPNLVVGTRVILGEGLKPIPESEWDTLINESDMAGVAAGAIYGESFDVSMDPSAISRAYSLTKEKENRFGFSLLAADEEMEVALAMGLAYIDDTVLPNATYRYALRLGNATPAEANGSSFEVKVESEAIEIAPQNIELMGGDSSMQITWNVDEGAPYSSYIIERSGDGGATFVPINDQPIIYTGEDGPVTQLFYSDDLPNNTQTFIYRIKGKNPFGLFGPYSEQHSAKGIPTPIAGPLKITEGIANEDETNTIVWDLPAEQESAIIGFKVLRASLRNGATEELTTTLLPVTHRTFSDPNPLISSYYRVVAVDADGQEVQSMAELVQLADSEPPLAPSELSGICTTDGSITLQWAANEEVDLKGYRVFVSNQADGRFTQVTEQWLRNPIFYYQVDMSNFAEAIYFKAVALDRRDNASDFSAACEVIRPDIHPPVAPVISSIEALADGVAIGWVASSSEDVVLHSLERKPAYSNSWTEVLRMEGSGSFSELLDSNATEHRTYNYRLIATDDAGNESFSQVKTINPLTNSIVDGITDLYGELFTNEKKVYLSWNYPHSNLIYGFDIYRSADNDTYRLLKTVKTEDCFLAIVGGGPQTIEGIGEYVFEDDKLVSQARIKYKVQVQYVDGRSSELSLPVVLLVQ